MGTHRLDLQVVRASALAQTRLQLAVLSGNRRRALEQIDRLVAIDRQLERLTDGPTGPLPDLEDLAGDLVDQRLAIASEKLALMSDIALPRLEPAFGAGMGAALAPHEPVEIVEHDTLIGHLRRLSWWVAAFVLVSLMVAAVVLGRL